MRGNESLVYRMILFRSCSPRSQCEADQPVPLEASYKITAAPTVSILKLPSQEFHILALIYSPPTEAAIQKSLKRKCFNL